MLSLFDGNISFNNVLRTVSFNCYGFNSSTDKILELCADYDIIFLPLAHGGEIDFKYQEESLDKILEEIKKVGRPKLGVISREITLQKKHWDWLDQQSASASAVIRKLIDKELNNPNSEGNIMLAKQAIDRFMSAMLGNMPNYEEATRALYQGDRDIFLKMIQSYPKDLREYLTLKTQSIF